MTATKTNQEKKTLARLYFMQGESLKSISEKTGVSMNSLSRWSKEGEWELKRAGMTITRPEIVNKNLLLISKLLDHLNDTEVKVSDMGRLIDQISKLAAAIERLDKKASVVDTIEVFSALNRWLIRRMEWDKEITPELLQTIEKYQDLYINEQIKK